MTRNTKDNIVEFIHLITAEFVEQVKQDSVFKGIFLTGSFVSYLNSSDTAQTTHLPETFLPDINYYVLIDGNDEYVVEYGFLLNRSIGKVLEQYERKSICINVVFDLHPFSITKLHKKHDPAAINIQFTTRIVDGSNFYKYAVHSWLGWRSNYKVLYPANRDIFQTFRLPEKNVRDEKWFRTLYLGLLSYGNVLQILPFYTDQKEFLISETYKYVKELIMDGIHIAVSNEELADRSYYKVIYGWKEYAKAFYETNYGNEAADIIQIAIIYSKSGNLQNAKLSDRPIEFTKLALRLRNIIYEKGLKKRLQEHAKKFDGDLFFEELPLWW